MTVRRKGESPQEHLHRNLVASRRETSWDLDAQQHQAEFRMRVADWLGVSVEELLAVQSGSSWDAGRLRRETIAIDLPVAMPQSLGPFGRRMTVTHEPGYSTSPLPWTIRTHPRNIYIAGLNDDEDAVA